MLKKYKAIFFDLDDTLIDSRKCQKLAFQDTCAPHCQTLEEVERLFRSYKINNSRLWKELENGKITKEYLCVERFRETFFEHGIKADIDKCSAQ